VLGAFNQTSAFIASRIMLPADTTTTVDLVATRQVDYRVNSIVVINGDVTARAVLVVVTSGGVTTVLGSATIPAGQGLAGTPGLDLLALVLPATQVGLDMPAGSKVQAAMGSTIGAGNAVHLTAVCGNY